MGEGSPQSIVGVVSWKLKLYAPPLRREGGNRKWVWGGRKPELESQTKRVTQKQRLRDTGKTKKGFE